MQTPVRYYIVKTDDQPVVKTVPVTMPEKPAMVSDSNPTPETGGAIAPLDCSNQPRGPRVARLVRAVKRGQPAS